MDKFYDELERPYDGLMRRSTGTSAKAISSENLGEESAQRSQEQAASMRTATVLEVIESVRSQHYGQGDTGFYLDGQTGSGQFSLVKAVSPAPVPTSSGTFFRCYTMTGAGRSDTYGSIFWGEGTTSPNGILTGNPGDLCLSESGKTYLCSTGTTWVELGSSQYGSIYMNGSDVAHTLTNASQEYSLRFDSNGPASGLTADASNYRVSFPSAGTYHINANVSVSVSAANYLSMGVRLSNSIQWALRASENIAATGSYVNMSVSGIVTSSIASNFNCCLITDTPGTVATVRWGNLNVVKL